VLPITIALAALCLIKLGGVDGLFERIAAAGLSDAFLPIKSADSSGAFADGAAGRFTLAWFTAWIINGQMTQNSMSQAQRYLYAKDGREARKAAGMVSALFVVAAVVWVIPPITSRLLFADQVMDMPLNSPADGAYAVASLNLLPIALVGLVLVAVFAATMSSLDSGLTSLAGIITQNIYPALCRRFGWAEKQGRSRLLLGRIVNLSCCLTMVLLALVLAASTQGSVFDILLNVIVMVGAPLVIPNFWGLFIRRTPSWAWIASMSAGFLGSALVISKPWIWGGGDLPLPWQVALVHGSGTLGFFISCLFYRKDDLENEARLDEFFRRRNTPIDFAKEIGGGNDCRQLRIAGTFGVVMGAAIALLAVLPSSRDHVPLVLSVASGSAGLGILLLFGAKRARRISPAR
jgi:Na+/proline symporter